MSQRRSFWCVFFYNLFPLQLVFGSATSDMVFMMLFGVLAFYLFLENKLYAAILISYLAVGSRIQSIAITFPLMLILLHRDLRERRMGRGIIHGLVGLGLLVLVYSPVLIALGPKVFMGQPYHDGEFTKLQLVGAFVNRTFNILGPIGLVLAVWTLWREKILRQKWDETKFLSTAVVILTLVFVWIAPWENYYLLPIVPVLFFTMFKIQLPRPVLVAFVLSALIPNISQIQFKPWKAPFFAVKEGIISAHLRQGWLSRSGG